MKLNYYSDVEKILLFDDNKENIYCRFCTSKIDLIKSMAEYHERFLSEAFYYASCNCISRLNAAATEREGIFYISFSFIKNDCECRVQYNFSQKKMWIQRFAPNIGSKSFNEVILDMSNDNFIIFDSFDQVETYLLFL